jgi:hypothetical protein
MRSEVLKNPRRLGKHVSGVLDYLANLGIQDIEVIKSKHLRVSWKCGRHSGIISMPCTPRDEDNALRQSLQKIRQEIARHAG